jgi:hypothetical protein
LQGQLKRWPEHGHRDAIWLPASRAARLIHKAELRQLIERFAGEKSRKLLGSPAVIPQRCRLPRHKHDIGLRNGLPLRNRQKIVFGTEESAAEAVCAGGGSLSPPTTLNCFGFLVLGLLDLGQFLTLSRWHRPTPRYSYHYVSSANRNVAGCSVGFGIRQHRECILPA